MIVEDVERDIDSLPEERKSALNRLSQDELDTLASIRAKLNEEPEVAGHAMTRAGRRQLRLVAVVL